MNPCPVLVGRQQELATLRSLLEAGGGVALISGEAGIGKSRLVREFAAEAEKAGRVVLWGRPEEVAQPGPYALIVDLLESIAERGIKQTATDARSLIAELLRPVNAAEQRPAPSPRSIAAEIRGLVAQLDAPPLIVLEDLHGADESSHAVIHHLARAAADDGHLILGSLRTEAMNSLPSLSRFLAAFDRARIGARIELSPLDRQSTEAMLRILLGREVADSEVDSMIRLGEGIPFYIEELAADVPVDSQDNHSGPIARTVRDRLLGLGDDDAQIVRLASITVGAIDAHVLARAAGLTIEEITKSLIRAATQGLISDDEGKLRFRHALVRESIASELVSVEAAQLHDMLAHAIEEVHAGELEIHATALAHHYRECGATQPAVKYALMAGERALALAATEEARKAFENASQLSERASGDAISGLAEVEFREGNEEQAGILFRRAADLFESRGDLIGSAQALGRLSWTQFGQGDPSQVLATLDEGIQRLPKTPNADMRSLQEYARLIIQKGNALSFVFLRFEEAFPVLTEAAEIARRLDHKGLLADALDGLAQVAQFRNEWSSAIALCSEAIEAAVSSADPEVIGRTHNNFALVLASTGRPLEALEVLSLGREKLKVAYGRAAVSALDVTHAWVAWLMGQPAEVTALAARGHEAWRRWRGYRHLLQVWAALERGEERLAEQIVSTSWEELGGDETRQKAMSGSIELNRDTSQALHGEALVCLAKGSDAYEVALRAAEADRANSESFDLGQTLVLLARAYLMAGRAAEAVDTLRELNDLAESYPYLLALTKELEGIVEISKGRHEAARTLLTQAADALNACSNGSDQARCRRLLAETLLLIHPESTKEKAIEQLKLGRDLADKAGASVEASRCEAKLRGLGVRPRAGRPRGSKSEPGHISPREAEVAVLVAAGEANATIAERLFLSERTVQDHITNALRKLGLSGRAGLASWAVKQGMI